MGELGDVTATVLKVNVLIPSTRNDLPNDAASCHRRHKFTCFIKLIFRGLYSRNCKKLSYVVTELMDFRSLRVLEIQRRQI
jgi:hypothetical protein